MNNSEPSGSPPRENEKSYQPVVEPGASEEAVRESEENYRELADAMPQIVWTARPDGFLDYYNRRWFDYTGMTLEETVGWGWAPVLHPDDLANCVAVWTKAIETGEKYTVEYRFKRHSDGAYRWHLGQALPVRDRENRIVKWYGTCTDIHEQKQVQLELQQIQEELESRVKQRTAALARVNADLNEQIAIRRLTEEQLHENRRFIESVTQNSTSIIYVFDVELVTNVYSNREVTDFLGYSLEETQAMGATFIPTFTHPDDLAFINEHLTEFAAMNDSDVMEFEVRLKHHTGEWRWVWFRERVFKRGADGAVRQIMGTGQDVTERKRIESALSSSTKRERAMIENAPDVICTVDEEGRFASVNPACFKMWGYQPEELIGRRYIDLVAPEDVPDTNEVARRMMTGEEIPNFENRYRHKNGTLVNVVWVSHWSSSDRLIFAVAHDVTERRRAEAELKKERKFLDAVLANMTDGLVACNADGELTLFNRASQELHGLPAEALAAEQWTEHYDLYRADGRTPLSKEEIPLFRALQGETISNVEMVIAPKNREPRTLIASGQAIFDADDKKIGAVVGMRDVTERKQAESRTQVIFEIIQGVVTTSNLDELLALVQQSINRTIYAENFYVALYDKHTGALHIPFCTDKFDVASPPTKLGRGLTAYAMRDGHPMLLTKQDIYRLIESGEVELLGTPPAVWLGVPLRTPNEIIGVLVVQHYEDETAYTPSDIELLSSAGDQIAVAIERKRLEEKLREQAQHLSAIVETQNDIATSELDLEKVMNLIVERAQRLTGASGAVVELVEADEMVYRAVSGAAAAHLGLRLKIDDSLSGYCVKTGEIILCEDTEDDARVNVEACRRIGVRSMLLVPLRKDRKPVGVLKVTASEPRSFGERDIQTLQLMASVMDAAVSHTTEFEIRKEVETELKRARDVALESARLKSEFLANMSHEIRTPMNGVIGMTGILLETSLDADQKDYVETIQISTDALLRIIDDILDFSKIEAGQLNFETIDFDLSDAVEGAVELLAERAQSKNLEIASIIYGAVPTALTGDPGRLRQILTNLLGNAVKFTETGEITVAVRVESETDAFVVLRFEVTDTGIGIDAAAQSRLFQAFMQADGSTTRKYGGTGLGLAISKQLVELMNGDIGVESEPGSGSTFRFTARFGKQTAAEASPSTAARRAADGVSLAGLRVLIVDDNQTNRRILSHQTAAWGMIAAEAEAGVEALTIMKAAAAAGQPFEIAILDLMMPEMDGFELAQRIKADVALARTHLVLLPSYGKRGHGEMARAAEIAAYLQKPVRQSQLYNCLAEIITAAKTADNTSARQSPELITQHHLNRLNRQKPISGGEPANPRILVAEDNLVNQKVAFKQLQNLGYAADLVSNGREAVEAVENHEYAIVLMDCQMPVADGFEATAEIRRRQTGAHRTIIIAMTAHALEGEREKCLAAGMDDYLSKPVKLETLGEMLKKWLVRTAELPGESLAEKHAPAKAAAAAESIDAAVLAVFKDLQPPDEPDLVTELIDLFLEDARRKLATLKHAAERRDASAIKDQAHGVKGSSANVGAHRLARLSGELEENAADIERAQSIIAEMENEFETVDRTLQTMRQTD